MKIRVDFVTNSSSSSFIALNKEDYSIDRLKIKSSNPLVIGKEGNREFTRVLSVNNDFYSKLNFLALSILSLEEVKKARDSWYMHNIFNKIPDFFSVDYKEMLNQLIQKELNLKLDWKLIKKLKSNADAYIDHQSLFEGIPEILKDEDSMKRFLFNDKSLVVFDGDESGCCFQLLNRYFMKNSHYEYIDNYSEEESTGFYIFITDLDNVESTAYKTEEKDLIRIKDRLKILVKDKSIPDDVISNYLDLVEIYRIDNYSDWYEEYVFNNEEVIKNINIEEVNLEEYRKKMLENQKKIKDRLRQIIDKMNNVSIWLITNCFYLDKTLPNLDRLEIIDKLFDENKLFKEEENLIYFRAMNE